MTHAQRLWSGIIQATDKVLMNGAIKSAGSRPRPNLAHARNDLHFAADRRYPFEEDGLEYDAVGPAGEVGNLRELVKEPVKNRYRSG